MHYKIEITNFKKYSSVVKTVELNFHKGGMVGDVSIFTIETEICLTGEHGANDYEDDYGFIIVPVVYGIIDSTCKVCNLCYVYSCNSIGGDVRFAMLFETAELAQEYINGKNWGEWACVVEL